MHIYKLRMRSAFVFVCKIYDVWGLFHSNKRGLFNSILLVLPHCEYYSIFSSTLLIMEGSSKDNSRARTPENVAEKTAEIVSNMALAHELVMNDKFEFQDFPDNS